MSGGMQYGMGYNCVEIEEFSHQSYYFFYFLGYNHGKCQYIGYCFVWCVSLLFIEMSTKVFRVTKSLIFLSKLCLVKDL